MDNERNQEIRTGGRRGLDALVDARPARGKAHGYPGHPCAASEPRPGENLAVSPAGRHPSPHRSTPQLHRTLCWDAILWKVYMDELLRQTRLGYADDFSHSRPYCRSDSLCAVIENTSRCWERQWTVAWVFTRCCCSYHASWRVSALRCMAGPGKINSRGILTPYKAQVLPCTGCLVTPPTYRYWTSCSYLLCRWCGRTESSSSS
ncbi:hypothetical protein E2C01_083712 [Portunus trituberculatus]|uniref:Uncharacterized protein n=1 Tax=Portunus trituberculatus TaxID=210409 RepID=A0A5B7IT61_PORTR|nr:hypothetical protein [Portunus trituberculatus]